MQGLVKRLMWEGEGGSRDKAETRRLVRLSIRGSVIFCYS